MVGNKLGVGLVGAGAIAQLHARVLEASGQAALAGVYDASESAARALAGHSGAAAYARLSDLLEDPAVDAVAVLTPSGAREPIVRAAAAAGKHVICEKPVEIALDRIDRMIEVCRSNGVQLACVLNNRYNPVYSRIHECVQSGKLGRMILGDVSVKWYREPDYYRDSPWRGTWAMDGGGALMNQSIHFVDLLLWMMGPVRDVSAYAATNLHAYIEVEDMAV
nr:Gfo/Idh/MocA family oxidoreductase [Clostridia bacterium]